jgi:hypothetical protein
MNQRSVRGSNSAGAEVGEGARVEGGRVGAEVRGSNSALVNKMSISVNRFCEAVTCDRLG